MQDAGIYARHVPALDRVVELGAAQGRVVGVSFPSEVSPDAASEHPLLDRLEDLLGEGGEDLADVEVALTVPTDHRAVLEAVRSIPRGETVDTGTLARLAGLDDESDADRATVEAALRENPVPLFVPDHRVEAPGATPDEVVRRLRALES
jgi:methylated-DNA-[protein]-cysteine S-methyltransferase